MRLRTAAVALGITLMAASCGSDAQTTSLSRSASSARSAAPPSSADTAAAAPSTTVAAPTTSTPATLTRVALASSPEELAARVVAAETVARDPATPPDRVRLAAFELQVLYRQSSRHPEWDGAVLAATPPHLHLTVSSNNAARREFRSMHSKLSDTLPPWRIVDPPPAEELLAYYQEGEATFGVPWHVLAAVNLVETGMGRIRGTSIAGAQGPMQFMPATWAAFGEGGDVHDTHDAIMGAARYLAHNGGGSGDIDGALWNYNHSNKYVRGVKHYSAVMAEDPAAFRVFYNWQVVYLSTVGDIWMPTGYEATERVPVTDYVAANPGHHLTRATN